ncbi:hypothetical protein PSTT_00396 [Puccinia striiformis]|uniref:Uncharacterized protein n=1 Tax=Puccinia striiformis TaxID=27350 RepID=A0A2S4W6Y7_9BASI|nr:hypothetical protein PSTT_00396 [Puccinia striiformis]
MGKGRKIDPFHHETRRQKKKREKDAPRDLASQQTLTSLVDGTYQPPRIGNHPRASTSSLRPDSSGGDVGNMDQHPDHYGPDHDDGDYDHMLDSQSHLAHHGSLAATSALSAWGSIPWDVPCPQPRPERYSPKKRRYLAETHAQVVSGVYVAQGEDPELDSY